MRSVPLVACGLATASLLVMPQVGAWGSEYQSAAGAQSATTVAHLELVLATVDRDNRRAAAALDELAANWQPGYASMLLDLARLPWPTTGGGGVADDVPPPPEFDDAGRSDGAPRGRSAEPPALRRGSPIRQRLLSFLERQTGQRLGTDLDRWRAWTWTLDYRPHPEYLRFKGLVFRTIDPRMEGFFSATAKSLIRLDEVDWGGVTVNGIPPLVYPKTVPASEARYLRDDHIVFGVEVEGEARAYPKRILAWHEMARDRVGGVELTVVYCTLCGTVIPYESEVGGRRRTFGTSGLLYRSNKLMFDEETRSLWSTLEGRPVIGPLAGTGLQLKFRSAMTTTWGEWRSRFPSTRVLSLDTGFQRDYAEGAAYRAYFATDELMFGVPHTDDRLKRKDDVLVMKLPGSKPDQLTPVAVSSKLLLRTPVLMTEAAGHRLVIVTSPRGGSQVYDAGDRTFVRRIGDGKIVDADGGVWTPREKHLSFDRDASVVLARVPSHHAFWFGWFAQYPETLLIR